MIYFNHYDRFKKLFTLYKHTLLWHIDIKPRGPTLGEISYALAEITEIKFEIAKSFIKEKSQANAEIRNQSTIYKVSVKSRKCLDTTSANLDIFATCTCHVSLHECSREDV